MLTQEDVDKIQEMDRRLKQILPPQAIRGVFLKKEHYEERTQQLYLVEYSWQIGMEEYILYVNVNACSPDRYGWERKMLFGM